MIHGTLVINLDPPYAGFSSDQGQLCKNFTVEELRALISELGILAPGQVWAPRDYMVRLPGKFSSDALAKFGLIHRRSLTALRKSAILAAG